MGRAAKREARKKREQKLSIEEQADVDIRGFGIGTHVRFNCPDFPNRHGKEGVISGVNIAANETYAERIVDFGDNVGCGARVKELIDIGCKACSNHEKNAIHKDGGAHGHAFESKQEPICHECGFPASHDIHVPGTEDGHGFKPTVAKVQAPPEETVVERTAIELLGPEFTIELARVDPTQVFNVREVITEDTIMVRMRAIRQGTTKAIVLYPADKAKEIAPVEFTTDKEFIPLAGNITLLAALRDERTTYQARLFLGTPEEAKYYVGADNEGAVALTSFERARWYASLQTSHSYTDLANELLEWGVYVSPGQISNLVSAYRNLLPEIREAWAERRLLTPDETEDDLPVWSRLVTDECLFWLKGKNPNQQLLIWERMKDGDNWKAIRAAEKEKAPEGIKPQKQLYGRAIVPPKPADVFGRMVSLKTEVAKNNPEIVHLIEPIVAHMMTDLPLPKVMSFLESKKPVPPKKKIPARPIAVKKTRKIAAKSVRR